MEDDAEVVWRWGIGNAGWVCLESNPRKRWPDRSIAPPGVVLYVRFAPTPREPQRLAISDVLIHASDGGTVDASTWRQVNLGRLERMANDPANREVIASRLDLPGPLVREVAQFFAQTGGNFTRDGGEPRDWWASMYASQIVGSEIPEAKPLRRFGQSEPWTVTVEQPDIDATIRGADQARGRRADSFYEEVARVYRLLIDYTTAPAQAIASANGIEKVTTVHYWIREARARGFLPRQGIRGKAG